MRTGETAAGWPKLGWLMRLERVTALAGRIGPALAGSVLPFTLVFYLALKGGGYDAIVRSEVGIAVWWLVLLGTLAGVLPRLRLSRAGWVALGLLGAFAAWTALGISWSESSEQSAAELARVAAYLGIFVLALFIQGRDGLRRMVSALALAIALVGALALLSRLEPEWFPPNQTAEFLPQARERLNYPLNFWNGLAELIAIGIPLVLATVAGSRRPTTQALACAALPAMGLAVYYTFSRGGAIAAAIALLVFFALHPRRLAVLPTVGLAAVGTGLLVAAAAQRTSLADGLASDAARREGDEMLVVVLVVCAGVALIQGAIGLAARHGIGPRVSISRRATARVFTAIAAVAMLAAVAAVVSGQLGDQWEQFKQPQGAGVGTERFTSVAGNARYQYWQSMLDANATDPLRGIGPGVFEYWWARNSTITGFVRDAHSLYFETLGELGIVGLLLVGGLILLAVGSGVSRAIRARPEHRGPLAAATAGCAAFAFAAGVDWLWELTVLPVAFLLLAGAVFAHRDASSEHRPGLPAIVRWATAPLVALASVVVIAIPMAATSLVRDSREEMHSDLSSALNKARAAERLQPYAASPKVQEALVLEAQGNLPEAVRAARDATGKEATNWRTWYVLSRVEGDRGRREQAARAYREARSLNPGSPLFASRSPFATSE